MVRGRDSEGEVGMDGGGGGGRRKGGGMRI